MSIILGMHKQVRKHMTINGLLFDFLWLLRSEHENKIFITHQ